MPNGWSPKEIKLGTVSALGAGLTDTVISDPFSVTAGGSRFLVVAVRVSGVTVGGGITAKLQTGLNGSYFDSKTASITANGTTFIRINNEVAGDQGFVPLLASGRVVISTGAGSAVTIESVSVLQDL